MKLFHSCTIFKLILTGEDFLVRKATILDWQKRTVDMRVQFIQMYNECSDVLLTISATNELINILGPAFNVTLPFDAGIVRTFFKVHLLRTESKFLH